MITLERRASVIIVRRALAEDGAARDLTGPLLEGRRARGRMIAKQDLVLAGLDGAAEAFRQMGARFTPKAKDGQAVRKGRAVGVVEGPARAVLAAERTALNLVQQLSGVATLTRRFVELARPTRVFDTRKTVPGLRVLQKHAVRMGGGHNHRMGLDDGAMVKDNHVAAVGDEEALRERIFDYAARGVDVVIEAQSEAQALLFATWPVKVLMLDNFSLDGLRRAVRRIRALAPGLEIEASGGVTLETVKAIARTGVDRVSVGALTHSAPARDLSLEVEL